MQQEDDRPVEVNKSPERDPNKSKSLIYNNGTPNRRGKDGLFNKWLWNN